MFGSTHPKCQCNFPTDQYCFVYDSDLLRLYHQALKMSEKQLWRMYPSFWVHFAWKIKNALAWCRLLWEYNIENIISSQTVISSNKVFFFLPWEQTGDYRQFDAVLYLFRHISSKHLKSDVWIETPLKSICLWLCLTGFWVEKWAVAVGMFQPQFFH